MKFYLFGALTVDIDGKEINLEEYLGRQLSMVFALFLCNHKQILTKKRLIDLVWDDSKSPSNALKFAIFRLRNLLEKHPDLKNYEWIMTAKYGYQLNQELHFEMDIEKFEETVSLAKANGLKSHYEEAVGYYKNNLLVNMNEEWIILDRGYFSALFMQVAENLSNIYIEQKDFSSAISLCKKALGFDGCNELIINNYLEALVETKQYQIALNFYEDSAKLYSKTTGSELKLKNPTLLNIALVENKADTKVTIKEFSNQLIENGKINGPIHCDYPTFKNIARFEYRNCVRRKIAKYMIMIELNGSKDCFESAMRHLMQIIDTSMRMNDVVSQVSTTQLAILVDMCDENEATMIVRRLLSRFSKLYLSSEIELTYRTTSLMDIPDM